MDALETLLEEHEIITKTIDVLDIATKRLQPGEKIPAEVFEKILDIIKNFADKCHHGKEENVLFPLIKGHGKNDDRIVSMFLEDHEKGRAYVRALSEAVSENDTENIIKNANGYVGVLPIHIQKENAIFPAWINPLSDETKKELFEKFEEIEEKVIGLGKHQEYVKNINKLRNEVMML